MTPPVFQPFDVYAAPLDRPTLIEASAGTGKTWAIGGLYVRLILERELAVENILVVTYTKAATAELGARIRRKLVDMLGELKGEESGDVFCKTYASCCAVERERAIRRLTQSLRCLDDAAIFTIHGFCQRILTEWAFESGMEFDSELLTDEREILGEIIDDFWRREIQPARGAWVDYLVDAGQTPDVWLAEMLPHIGKSAFMALAPLAAGEAVGSAEAALDKAYGAARGLWQGGREDISGVLLEHPGLSQTSYKKASLSGWLADFDAWFAASQAPLSAPDKLVKLTPAALVAGTKKGHTPPQHPFFPACEILLEALGQLQSAFARRLILLKADLLAWCESELPERKRARRLISYHDLLNRLAQALDGPHGAHLAALVKKRYPAALIDEFQDTDPVQYRIFHRLYAGQPAPVFFVGDPKQAIYGFRGADVYTYLEAYRDVDSHTTQNVNQRSSAGLIAAVNALFAAPRPFLVEEIGYRPVQASDRDLGRLSIPDEEDGAALQFRLFPPAFNKDKEVALNKDAANAMAAGATAAEIAWLLSSGACLEKGGEGRPLSGGDIAVLVPAHRQGRQVQEELTKRGVASVRYGQDNVFESNEARELESLLRAVAEPGRDDLVRAALASEALGGEGGALFALRHDQLAGERVFAAFRRYHELWRDQGFMRFFRAWLDDNQVALRLLRFQDGERRLTNWLHLAELLQVESHQRQGMEALLGWLSRTLRAPRGDHEAALLRLESDAARVRIVTIHGSKGLEYPVVFCPFLWDGQLWRKNETTFTFHDADHHRPTLDLGSPMLEANRRIAGAERLAEKLRLLYVALTRAQYRCYVTWGNVKGVETAALAWLLYGPGGTLVDPVAAMEARFAEMTRAELEVELHAFAARADGCVSVAPLVGEERSYTPAAEATPALSAANFTRSLSAGWRMTSFSALSQGRHSEAPDYDASPARHAEMAPRLDIFAFPRGAQPGTCLHAIFEQWDFTRRDELALRGWVGETLRAHFIDEKWAPTVARMVQATLDARLDRESIRLADVTPSRKLVEMGFSYPLGNLDAPRLAALLANPAYGVAPEFAAVASQLDFRQMRGYMMGFIDLVFEAQGQYFIVDYKSNWLGGDLASYAPPALTHAMADAHYYLQYLIYCVALHRYLRIRVADYAYERHFGGVYYLFLRGIDPAQGGDTGIFRDRPRLALIEALDRLMAGGHS
ncbi:MAG: exodeoxyribonuclease V subunit beta [Sulfuricella sp.]|nr:exodeoxyribonuclease V subunit beta [Sulfuricella sp.]